MTPAEKAIRSMTPGRLIQLEFLDEYGLSQSELSRRTGIPRSTINEILKDKRPISVEVAIALSAFFGNSPQFWLNLANSYRMRLAELDDTAAKIRKRVRPLDVV